MRMFWALDSGLDGGLDGGLGLTGVLPKKLEFIDTCLDRSWKICSSEKYVETKSSGVVSSPVSRSEQRKVRSFRNLNIEAHHLQRGSQWEREIFTATCINSCTLQVAIQYLRSWERTPSVGHSGFRQKNLRWLCACNNRLSPWRVTWYSACYSIWWLKIMLVGTFIFIHTEIRI